MLVGVQTMMLVEPQVLTKSVLVLMLAGVQTVMLVGLQVLSMQIYV